MSKMNKNMEVVGREKNEFDESWEVKKTVERLGESIDPVIEDVPDINLNISDGIIITGSEKNNFAMACTVKASRKSKSNRISIPGKLDPNNTCNIVFTNNSDYIKFSSNFNDHELNPTNFNHEVKVYDYSGDLLCRYSVGRSTNKPGNLTFNKPSIFSFENINFVSLLKNEGDVIVYISDIEISKIITIEENFNSYFQDSLIKCISNGNSVILEAISNGRLKFIISSTPYNKLVINGFSDYMNSNHTEDLQKSFVFTQTRNENTSDIQYLIEYSFGKLITEQSRELNTFLKFDNTIYKYMYGTSFLDSKSRNSSSIITCLSGGRIELVPIDGLTYHIVMIFKKISNVDTQFKFGNINSKNSINSSTDYIFFPVEITGQPFILECYEVLYKYFKIMVDCKKSASIHDFENLARSHSYSIIRLVESKDIYKLTTEVSSHSQYKFYIFLRIFINTAINIRNLMVNKYRRSFITILSDINNLKDDDNESTDNNQLFETCSPSFNIGRACSSYYGKSDL